ncbi:DUF3179 domain-containing protein, partial [Candidatus Woesearchaeota archaeon]|nr:DUF3179 domain-containing protein [Candidatus Woesearchaeota archaeon]
SREVRILPDGTRYVIHPSKLESGGPPKDGIPSIDEPKIVSAREADAWLRGDELILGVNLFGTPRAYPFQILVWHELVNDVINGNPVLISYCPLCGTGIAFDRNVDGSLLSFGVSGKLYNSDLIMYDRKTDSYWMQLSGEAIIGEMAGARLKMLPADTVPWKEWKALHPDTGVLSKDTGHSRDYGSDPYGDYYKSRSVWFALEHEDARLHPKTVIYGIEAKGAYKAYTYDALIKEKKIKDDVGGVNVLIAMDDYGIVTVKNIETGEEIPKVRSFWFAWAATYPNTEVYSP